MNPQRRVATMTMRLRMLIAFVAVLVLVITLGIRGWLALNDVERLSSSVESINEVHEVAAGIDGGLQGVSSALEGYAISGDGNALPVLEARLAEVDAELLELEKELPLDFHLTLDLDSLIDQTRRLTVDIRELVAAPPAGVRESAAQLFTKLAVIQGASHEFYEESEEWTTEALGDQASVVSRLTAELLLIGVAMVTIIAAAWIFVSRSLGRIDRMTQTAIAIAAGELDREVAEDHRDEIGMLAGAFNSMTRQLRELINSLESRVEERTSELSATNSALSQEVRERERAETKLEGMYEELSTAHDDLKETQTQLLNAKKLEAIGSLAAGIAHEINTPIQFISDNTAFVKEAIGTLAEVTSEQSLFLTKAAEQEGLKGDAAALQALWKEKDCDFLMEEIPAAAGETIEGAARVAEIVRAMKEFAHPGTETKTDVDVNRVIATTAQLSRNEWKYVAELELDLDDTIPIIQGHAGPLGQALLIMFVNSAQAMAETRDEDRSDMGTIRVSTAHRDGFVELRIADDGPGIPLTIVDRIFDPFFTTKDVGKGSGQGLSIARSVVVDKHEGEIRVEDGNPGAVFVIRLPVDRPEATVTTPAMVGAMEHPSATVYSR